MLDFIVLGMPRSGTTWVANWLTTDKTLCLHDPFAQSMPIDWPKDQRKRGISCTMAYMLEGWLEQFNCPIAIIQRPVNKRNDSLMKMGLPPIEYDPKTEWSFNKVKGLVFDFDDLWNEEKAKLLFKYLLPAETFDSVRYRQLVRMQVQPHGDHWTMNFSVLAELRRIGLLDTAR